MNKQQLEQLNKMSNWTLEEKKANYLIIQSDNTLVSFTDGEICVYGDKDGAIADISDCNDVVISVYNYLTANRFLSIGEEVYIYDVMSGIYEVGKIGLINGKNENGWVNDDDIILIVREFGEVEEESRNIYVKSVRHTNVSGEGVYYEHNDSIDYPFFVPSCDENYYECELFDNQVDYAN